MCCCRSSAPSLHVVLGSASKDFLTDVFKNEQVDENDSWLIQMLDISNQAIQDFFAGINIQYNSLTYVFNASSFDEGEQYEVPQVRAIVQYVRIPCK